MAGRVEHVERQSASTSSLRKKNSLPYLGDGTCNLPSSGDDIIEHIEGQGATRD